MATTKEIVKFEEAYAEAHAAGMEAALLKQPETMHVTDGKQVWSVSEGVCGFAWINIKPGNSKVALWLKKRGYARRDSYYGGVTIWVGGFGQSYERKMAYATEFARVFAVKANVSQCYASGRLD